MRPRMIPRHLPGLLVLATGACSLTSSFGHMDDCLEPGACEAPAADEEEDEESPCVGQECPLTCEPDEADCDGELQNGCETDLAADGEHCGACGHSCLGGMCVAGMCGVNELTSLAGSGSLA